MLEKVNLPHLTRCIWISGPTGAGKSTLATALHMAGYAIIKEEIPQHLFEAFFSNRREHCYQLQKTIIHSRYRQWLALQGQPKIAFDRSIEEDVHIFCKLHRQLGFLTDSQLYDLTSLSQELQLAIPRPNVIVYLRPSQPELRRRLAKERQPDLIQTSLDIQLQLYSEWFEKCVDQKISINNTHCSAETFAMLLGC